MARIRTIKPDFWTDEKIVELSPLARLLFIGLWNFADDEGRMPYSPTRIKLQILPADSCEISALLGEIRGKSLVDVYVVDGEQFLQICGFEKHQKIDKRSASKYPKKPEGASIPAESPRIPPTEVEVEVEVEGNRKGSKPAAADAARVADPDPAKSEIWLSGKRMLESQGVGAKEAGSFIGKLCKDFGQILVLQAVRDCVIAAPAEAKSWLVARCQERRKTEQKNGKFNPMQYTAHELTKIMDGSPTPQVRADLHGKIQQVLPG